MSATNSPAACGPLHARSFALMNISFILLANSCASEPDSRWVALCLEDGAWLASAAADGAAAPFEGASEAVSAETVGGACDSILSSLVMVRGRWQSWVMYAVEHSLRCYARQLIFRREQSTARGTSLLFEACGPCRSQTLGGHPTPQDEMTTTFQQRLPQR